MKPLKPEQKKLLGVCALLIVVGLVIAIATPKFGVLFLLRELRVVSADLEVKGEQLEEAKRRQEILPQLEDDVKQAEAEIEEVERRLPSDKRAPELFTELDNLAHEAEQEYKSMDAKPVEEKGAYIEIPLEITLEAGYHNLGRYINLIERSERFAKIDQIEIAYDFDTPDIQDVKLTVSTFMFVEKKAATSSTEG